MKKEDNSKEEFMKKNFVLCPFCGYNNKKFFLYQYGTCLNCKKILDQKIYFMIEMKKKIKNNKRKSC